tara:strand:- start:1196 stop:1765 length:570 start_codon:yes stop_codon:yes gene_type:complete
MGEEYYHTSASVDEYIKLAKGVNGQELIGKLKQILPTKSNILELGSGPGSDWEILSKDYDVTGSDNSKEFLLRLITKFPKGEFLALDAVTITTDKKFDGIYSNKVLHHLTDDDLIASIQRQAELLKSEGIVCHSLWKGEGSEVFKGMFVNYHAQDKIKSFFAEYFDVLLLEDYKEFEDDDSILMIGRKK